MLRMSVELELDPADAFRAFVEELLAALRRQGLRFEPGPEGRVTENGMTVGRVVSWEPGSRAALEWRAAGWRPDQAARLVMSAEPNGEGARVAVEQQGWAAVVDGDRELVGWFASEMAAPVVAAMAPRRLGDWITDRQARRPSGARSRGIYRDPLFHYPNFRVILAELGLKPTDHLVEVGCGGGAFLELALGSGCRAAAVDHSPDMVRVAREVNRSAVVDGRLVLAEATAAALPFRDGAFSSAVMTGVLGFLPDPVSALSELRRVLAAGGRAVIMGADPEDRGTPAAPEPMASRLRFYDEQDLEELGRAAGFATVRAVRRDLEPHARAVGVPEEVLPLFAGGARFLLAENG